MKLSPSGLLEHAKSEEGRKQLRYAGVALVFVPVGQVLVQILHWATAIHDSFCILISACILTLPNYFANKVYVWRDTSRDNLRTQVLVFWVAAMLGTGFAMGFAYVSDELTENLSLALQSACLFMAQLAGYGIVWVARYFFLDLWLFRATHHGADPTAEEEAELHAEFPV